MERIRHIRGTQDKELLRDQTDFGETESNRGAIVQSDVYDKSTEVTPEQIAIREYLDSFDEEVLKEIFAEYFRKSGSDDESINWIPFDKIRLVENLETTEDVSIRASGRYSLSNGIELSSGIDLGSPEKILWMVIHEECHAISQDRVRTYAISKNGSEEGGIASYNKSGVSLFVLKKLNNSESVEEIEYSKEINEGITELIADKIFREYKKRTGWETYYAHPIQQNTYLSGADKMSADEKFMPYGKYWQRIKLYIGIVSAITGVPEDVVEGGVIRAYIRNGYLLDLSDSTTTFRDIHPDLEGIVFGIVESIRNDSTKLGSYVEDILALDISTDIKDKIVAALFRIKEEWGDAYKIARDSV